MLEAPTLAVLVALCLLLVVAWWLAHTRVRRRNLARQAVARRGEDRAERLLARQGYRVVDRQVTGRWTMWVDGEPCEVCCRADLLVESRSWAGRSRRYVAEVKTGEHAPDPTHPATRRQLLEYRLAFAVEGVLLVDMVEERVHRVAFPAREGRQRRPG